VGKAKRAHHFPLNKKNGGHGAKRAFAHPANLIRRRNPKSDSSNARGRLGVSISPVLN
jgi:hypothetical protein